MPKGIDHHKQTTANATHQLVANLAIAVTFVFSNEPIWIEKRVSSEGKIKAALQKTCLTLQFVPFEFHVKSVVH